ncbi:MAG: lysine--tRNA ligase [Verrucomicrobiota bacterium]
MSSEEKIDQLEVREEKRDALRASGIDPYGKAFPGTLSSQQVLDQFEEGKVVYFAGRIVSHRDMGKSHFIHLLDQAGKLQIYIKPKELTEEEAEAFKQIDLGDFVGVSGKLFTTRTGENTIHVESFTFLSKAMRPLPAKWHGLADVEQRYRQRYLDLIANEESKSVLTMRFRMIREIRRFLEERGFLEVETPMMQAVAGGAAAEPFQTRHKALGIDLYLRIAPELYLKRLLVGGYDRVFELNRNFRNEGISRKHNPEFTMLELYQAYSDYKGMADLMEELISHLALTLTGGTVLEFERPIEEGEKREKSEEGQETKKQIIDLTTPWKRIRYHDAVRDVAGQDWFELTPEQRRAKASGELGLEILPELEDFEVTNQVFEKLVEAKTVDPVFVTHLPKELVPLAKQNAENPEVVDVYELLINGQEISPGYSELNDPVVQRERLLEQAGEEVQKLDEEFLTALEHGMPPAGGLGLGIDRLAMLLSGAESIRDVLFFPLLKPKA